MSRSYRRALAGTIALSVVALASGTSPLVAQPSFRGLGGFTGVEPPESVAYGVSADGSTVVGSAELGNDAQAFRWTEATGLRGLGARPPGVEWTIGRGASADGSAVVGVGVSAGGTTSAFRWTVAGGMVRLPDLSAGAPQSAAWGVSGDGAVAVGWSRSDAGQEAARWAAGGVSGLGFLAGSPLESAAVGASFRSASPSQLLSIEQPHPRRGLAPLLHARVRRRRDACHNIPGPFRQ